VPDTTVWSSTCLKVASLRADDRIPVAYLGTMRERPAQIRRRVEMSDPENGLITVASGLSVRETIDRLLGTARSLGLPLDLVDLAFAVLLAAGLQGEQLRVPRHPL